MDGQRFQEVKIVYNFVGEKDGIDADMLFIVKPAALDM